MSRPLALLFMLVSFGLGVGVGILGLLYATGGNATPSRDAAEVAPTLSLDNPTDEPELLQVMATEIALANEQIDALSEQVNALSSGAVVPQTAVPDSDSEASSAADDTTTASASELSERALFRIDGEQSEVRFNIDETFFGNRKTVVGTTRRVAGDIIVNYQNPAASEIGTIAINARTLKTDNEFRDQSIRGQILESSTDEFEFITFVPTAIDGMPDAVAVGETVEFDVTGDLTIRGTTNSVTFATTITADSVEQITGFATTEVLYADFGLEINAPPDINDVADNVILEIDFVAGIVEE